MSNDINKANSNCKYKSFEGINLVHYCNMIYVPKTLHKRVFEWYHSYLQHTNDDGLAQRLTTVFIWYVVVDQEWKICRTFKYCQKFKRCNSKYRLFPDKDAKTLNPWHTVCVDLIVKYTILAKVIQTNNKILTK